MLSKENITAIVLAALYTGLVDHSLWAALLAAAVTLFAARVGTFDRPPLHGLTRRDLIVNEGFFLLLLTSIAFGCWFPLFAWFYTVLCGTFVGWIFSRCFASIGEGLLARWR